MQVKNTFSILFWINKSKVKNGEAPIWARVTVDGARVEISLKRSINGELEFTKRTSEGNKRRNAITQ